jgi:hypothetical protein
VIVAVAAALSVQGLDLHQQAGTYVVAEQLGQ